MSTLWRPLGASFEFLGQSAHGNFCSPQKMLQDGANKIAKSLGARSLYLESGLLSSDMDFLG